jgi:putative ATP-binding cassette transporter
MSQTATGSTIEAFAPQDLTPPDNPGETFAGEIARRPPLLRFVLAYWRSDDRWPGLGLLAIIMSVTFGTTYLMVWSNQLVGDVSDALVNRKWDFLVTALVTSVGVGVLSGTVTITNVAVTRVLDLRWRTWLTREFLDRWTHASAFYDIEREGLLKNADQRIAEDARLFAEQSLNMFTSLTSVVVSTVTFTALLWTLSKSLTIHYDGAAYDIPGYMVYIAYLYSIGSLLVTHYFGRKLIPLSMQRQGVEADYRYLAMQLRENAEQIAFYRGGPREHVRLSERFELVRQNYLNIIVRTWKVGVSQTAYGHLLEPLPTVAALPIYFAGLVTFGGMTRAVSAFGALRSDLSFFSQAYVGFTEWLAVTNRLRDLSAALDEAKARQGDIRIESGEGTEVVTGEIVLRTPQARILTVVPPLTIAPGSRWLIRGPSGTGKSTLLRAIAGIWPHGTGTIHTPTGASIMFLPQRSYIPSGSLKAALCYPSEARCFSDEQCARALAACDLERLVGQLHIVDHWQRTLSGGEQQRVAFARVLLQRPQFLFLDEATSALDPPTEGRLYQHVMAELPASAFVSIAHRESLARYHDRVLDLSPAA